jgi:hypothetical protein
MSAKSKIVWTLGIIKNTLLIITAVVFVLCGLVVAFFSED